MTFQYNHLPACQLEPAERTLRAAIHTWNHDAARPMTERSERVFVTVSRQPGAGAISFSHRLAERLHQDGQGDWSAWDRELVKKVSAEQGIAEEIIEMIPNRHHNWLDDLLQGFGISPNPPDVIEKSRVQAGGNGDSRWRRRDTRSLSARVELLLLNKCRGLSTCGWWHRWNTASNVRPNRTRSRFTKPPRESLTSINVGPSSIADIGLAR